MVNNINYVGLKIIENNEMICSKYYESSYNIKLNEIMRINNKINDYTNKIEPQIENIMKDYSNNLLDIKFKNIKDILTIIDENIKKTMKLFLTYLIK